MLVHPQPQWWQSSGPVYLQDGHLTHCGRNKMAAIFQMTFANTFSWMKMYEFWLKFHWSLFLGVQLTNDIPVLVQIMAWCRPGDKSLSELMMVSLLTHTCVTRPQWIKRLITSDSIMSNPHQTLFLLHERPLCNVVMHSVCIVKVTDLIHSPCNKFRLRGHSKNQYQPVLCVCFEATCSILGIKCRFAYL